MALSFKGVITENYYYNFIIASRSITPLKQNCDSSFKIIFSELQSKKTVILAATETHTDKNQPS